MHPLQPIFHIVVQNNLAVTILSLIMLLLEDYAFCRMGLYIYIQGVKDSTQGAAGSVSKFLWDSDKKVDLARMKNSVKNSSWEGIAIKVHQFITCYNNTCLIL